MRNLASFRNFIASNDVLKSFEKCTIFTEPSTGKPTYLCVVTDFGELYILETNCDDALTTASMVDLKETDCIEWLEDTSVVNIQQVYHTLYVTLNTGIFILFSYLSADDFNAYDSEVRDVLSVSWSGDFERTVLITSSSMMGVLNVENECEKFAYISLQGVEEESKKFVNVGWGSSETQFRGSEGKLTRKNEDVAETNAETTDNQICVVWKNDSSSFAVSYKCYREMIRKVKIFNQNGILMNMIRNTRGLETAIDWCPSVNLIFNVQKLPNKDVICFIEENGLRHGEFQLPKDIKLKRLSWNNQGTILAGLGEKIHETGGHIVLLWTTSNYKWYIKQKLEFPSRISYMQWDDQTQNRLHIILETGVYRMYEWIFQVIESNEYIVKKHHSKLICNINGADVGVTPYGSVFRPPSIVDRVVTFPCNVNSIVFGSTVGENSDYHPTEALLYSSNNTILKYNFAQDESTQSTSDEIYYFTVKSNVNDTGILKPIKFITPGEISALLWLPEDNRLYFCWTKPQGYYFCSSILLLEESQRWVIIDKCIKLNFRALIITTVSGGKSSCLLVHLENGAILLFKDEKLRLCRNKSLPEPCHRILSLGTDGIVAALTENRNLYVNNQIKWRDVGSFYWRAPFLVMLLSNSRMVIAKLNKNQFNEISNRRVEPKSYLITIVGDQVLLEMSRGNIELIIPRPFIANKMAFELNSQNYYQVFKLLRKQRINSNVIFDHDANGFLQNAKSIVQTIDDPSYLTLFTMELENSNVAERFFPWKYQKCGINCDDKVQLVCETLLSVLDEINSSKFTLPKIALLVRLEQLADAAKFAVENNELSFLFQLVDNTAVYKAVVASYDLPCALKIAEFSKMDPGDYLPFIKSLQKMDDNYKKFSINKYLGKYALALQYLAACSEEEHFEECVDFIEKHKLYVEAYEIFDNELKSADDSGNDRKQIATRYIKVTTMFAQYLSANKSFDEAAAIYEKIGLNDEALECYCCSGNWHSAISLAHVIYLNERDVSAAADLFTKLHNTLVSKLQYEDAAFVAFIFMKDSSLASKNYLTARKYRKALDAAKAFGGGLSTASFSLKPKLLQDAKSFIDDFHTHTNSLQQYVSRLRQIRDNESKGTADDDQFDRFSSRESVTSSESSTSTSSTRSSRGSVTSSAKRARRRERKLWNLKPGNPREKPSIINAIKELVSECDSYLSTRVPELVDVLLQIDERDVARQLSQNYKRFGDFVQRVVSEVWNSNELSEEGGFKDLAIKCPPSFTMVSIQNNLMRSAVQS